MPAPRASTRPTTTRRATAEVAVATLLVLACCALTGLGVLTWLLTFLQAAYPCGETHQVAPSCRLADPDAVGRAYGLIVTAPAAATLLGPTAGVLTFVRRRRAILPTALAFALALAAFLTGQALLDASLHDLVPQ